ncbi:MAG: acyl-CoA carboxylase subunit beta [Actinomycetota bacterium]|nr:acyl-CoA carboxylase subunit beta [Actinomycetota bacterium]
MNETEHDIVAALVDDGSFDPVAQDLKSSDPIDFPGYDEILEKARASSSVDESLVVGRATIVGTPIVIATFHFNFLGGSMGEVAGERLARGLELAAEQRKPFVLRTSTGGARMQEGMKALVQMPKVIAARATLASAGVPFIAVLGDPTTGGVLASIAALADVTAAESEATIGFAGPRVAELLGGTPLSGNSHTATSAFAHGLVDEVIPASEIRSFVATTLGVLGPDDRGLPAVGKPNVAGIELDPWDAVIAARAKDRPTAPDLARDALHPVIELRGDRAGTDDPALACFLGRLAGRRVAVLALDRAHLPGPGAFRKAKRVVAIAARLGLPIVTLIDTPGADPREGSENAGIAWEIASLFDVMLAADTPIISVVTGEGGSGGALAFAAGDVVLAYEKSIFSVIGPEGAAVILWRDGSRASEAAALLKPTAADLKRLGIADGLIEEPPSADSLTAAVAYHLARLVEERPGPEARRRRWRNG